MANLSDLFPSSGSVGSVGLKPGQTRNPADLQKWAPRGMTLYEGSTSRSPASVEFWTNGIAAQGAIATGWANNTYKTLCDLTGYGEMYAAFAPTAVNASDNVDFRITVDGVETVVSFTDDLPHVNLNAWHVVLGNIISVAGAGPHDSFQGTPPSNLYNFNESQVGNADFISVPNQGASLIQPHVFGWLGLPRLVFDASLKVECKVTTVGVAGTGDYGGVVYTLGAK